MNLLDPVLTISLTTAQQAKKQYGMALLYFDLVFEIIDLFCFVFQSDLEFKEY